MSDEPTPDELRQAAEQRRANSQAAPLGQSVASLVTRSGARARSKSAYTHTATARVTAEMAESIGHWANARSLNTSDAVRELLRRGLDIEENS